MHDCTFLIFLRSHFCDSTTENVPDSSFWTVWDANGVSRQPSAFSSPRAAASPRADAATLLPLNLCDPAILAKAARWAPDDDDPLEEKHPKNTDASTKSAVTAFTAFTDDVYGDARHPTEYTEQELKDGLFINRASKFFKLARKNKFPHEHYKPQVLKGMAISLFRAMNDHAKAVQLATRLNAGGPTMLRQYTLATDEDLLPVRITLDNAMKEGTKAGLNNRNNAPRVTDAEDKRILDSGVLFRDDAYSFNLRIFKVYGTEWMLRGLSEHHEMLFSQLALGVDEDGVEVIVLDPRFVPKFRILLS